MVSRLKLFFASIYSLILFLLWICAIQPLLNLPIISLLVNALSILDFIFHEGGHLVFSFFLQGLLRVGGTVGDFLVALGGTWTQLAIPSILFLVAFFEWRAPALRLTQFYRPVSRSTALRSMALSPFFFFWIGQNCMRIAPYIADARARILPLVSPGMLFGSNSAKHDWNFILSVLNLLWADQLLGGIVFLFGILVMVIAGLMPFIYLKLSPENPEPTS